MVTPGSQPNCGARAKFETTSRSVQREKDHLEIKRSGRPTMQIYPLGGDRFFSRDVVTEFRFHRNAAGKIDQFIVDDDGVEQVHARIK